MPGKIKLYVLHGWSTSDHNQAKWQDFLLALSRLDIDPEFIPIPGFESELNRAFDIDDYASYLAKILPAQNINLLGHSMGGQLALHFAAKNPHRVDHLILMDSSGLRSNHILIRLKRTLFYVAAKLGGHLTKSDRARKWLYLLAREKDYLQARPILRQTMANLLSYSSHQDAADLKVPTLLIWGENDRVTPMWMAREYMSLIKSAQLQLIKEGRHSPQFTHPDQVAKLIAEFLL